MTVRSPAALAAAIAGTVAFAVAVVVVVRGRTAPDDSAVAVYVKPWATEDEMVGVYQTVLGRPHEGGRAGFALLEGIASVTLAGDEEQTILVVRFRDDLGKAGRDSLVAQFRRSPLVAGVQ